MAEKKKINLPNKLTLLRILLTVPLIFFMLWESRFSVLIALAIFCVASVTDFIDGKIARSRHLVTDFGKFLDPIADKIMVISVLICLLPMKLCSPVVVIIVLFREFLISSLRLTAAARSVVLAAGKSGKVKTAFQMISIIAVLALLSMRDLFGASIPVETVSRVLMWITAALTVYSGAEYLIVNKKYINIYE